MSQAAYVLAVIVGPYLTGDPLIDSDRREELRGQILSLLAGSVRLTHRLKRRLMLRTSVNFQPREP